MSFNKLFINYPHLNWNFIECQLISASFFTIADNFWSRDIFLILSYLLLKALVNQQQPGRISPGTRHDLVFLILKDE